VCGGDDPHNVLLAVEFNSDPGDRIRDILPKKKSELVVHEAVEKLSPVELAQGVREKQEGSVQKVTTRAQAKEEKKTKRE